MSTAKSCVSRRLEKRAPSREPVSAPAMAAAVNVTATAASMPPLARCAASAELEHSLQDILTNVTDDDPLVTGKIALTHLHELPDYYTRLEQMEEQAKRERGAT